MVQGYLAHKNPLPPRTLQLDYTWGRIMVLGWGGGSYERGTPVTPPAFAGLEDHHRALGIGLHVLQGY